VTPGFWTRRFEHSRYGWCGNRRGLGRNNCDAVGKIQAHRLRLAESPTGCGIAWVQRSFCDRGASATVIEGALWASLEDVPVPAEKMLNKTGPAIGGEKKGAGKEEGGGEKARGGSVGIRMVRSQQGRGEQT